MNRAKFITEALMPYIKDPKTCGLDSKNNRCVYLTPDGRMCVFGKHMINPGEFDEMGDSAQGIISYYGEDVLKEEYRGVLTKEQWNDAQQIHDHVAKGDFRAAYNRVCSVEEEYQLKLPELKEELDKLKYHL